MKNILPFIAILLGLVQVQQANAKKYITGVSFYPDHELISSQESNLNTDEDSNSDSDEAI